MAFLLFNLLGRHKVRRAANSASSLADELQFGSKAKIGNFDLKSRTKQNVTWLQISVQDLICLAVLESGNYLRSVNLNFEFVQPASLFYYVAQGFVWTKLKQHVNVFTVLKKVLELTNVEVLNLPMNGQFGHQFLFRSNSCEASFENDHAGMYLLCFRVSYLVAGRKSALAEQLPFCVYTTVVFSGG